MSEKLKKLLGTKPEELAQLQHDELKEYTLGQLRKFTKLIEGGSYEAADAMLRYSPAGDDMGCDNNYLPIEVLGGDAFDLGDALEALTDLAKRAQ